MSFISSLIVGSAVFDAMFNSTWPTSNEEIPLPDVEPASFLALLKFLYSDEVQVHDSASESKLFYLLNAKSVT